METVLMENTKRGLKCGFWSCVFSISILLVIQWSFCDEFALQYWTSTMNWRVLTAARNLNVPLTFSKAHRLLSTADYTEISHDDMATPRPLWWSRLWNNCTHVVPPLIFGHCFLIQHKYLVMMDSAEIRGVTSEFYFCTLARLFTLTMTYLPVL